MTRLGIAMLLASAIYAHDPITTKLLWTQEISRIVYRHCGNCHREGGSAMSLMTYEDARPWAKAIRDEVMARRMPPWGPVKGVGEFKDDPSLSQVEIDMIVNWVEGGGPQGDEKYLPPIPQVQADTKPRPAGRELALLSGDPVTLSAPAEVEGLRPVRLAAGESLEVSAHAPDGQVRRLIWMRNWRPEWMRTYWFRSAIRLEKGTRIAAYSGKTAKVALLLSR